MNFSLTYPPLVTAVFAAALIAAGAVAAWRSPRRTAKIRRALIALLALAALISPTITVGKRDVTSNLEVYLAVDLTGSMAAEDYDGNKPRLTGVRADLKQLTTELAGSRFSVISYSSVASRQLPLTTDARAVNSWAETARQEITSYSSGSTIDRPVASLKQALEAAKERNPANVRVLFVLTDGESTRGEAAPKGPPSPAAFGELAGLIDGGAVLGYGTASGGKMRQYDGTDKTGADTDAPYIKDPNSGGDAVSQLDEAALQAVAKALGVPYLHRTAPGSLDSVTAGIDAGQIAEDGRREVAIEEKVFWPFMIALAGLIALELFSLARDLKAMSARD
ncbi:hypothetical protein BSZ39_08175 [Bowdeniella nasicola]|uniref:VWFA domain-containing protein n=1 Tax=Bowdeniella nasicola TaxID=208480 RepID=A0A1Q5Q1W2_9ACTO|nr:VWA domain-containing protein [Bowdeniella nasicola]OKL53695.1 hypothetical protein BSZ39_08175 [Bowdeniella nasicola]